MIGAARYRSLALMTGVILWWGPLSAQETGVVVGHIVDHLSGQPVEDGLVGLKGTGRAAFTDSDGRFRLTDVSGGSHLLMFEHLAYGDKSHTIVVESGATLSLEIIISPTAITLEPLLVEVSPEAMARRARGTSGRRVTRRQIEAMENRAGTVGEALRALVPGITVWELSGFVGSGICIEYGRAMSMYDPRGCQMLAVIVDGVRMEDPSLYLEALQLSDIESIEVVPLSEAGSRFGLGTAYGALVIETRRPRGSTGAGANTTLDSSLAYDWTSATEAHPSARAFFGAAIGNAAGLLLASKAGGDCFNWFDLNREIREVECRGVDMTLAQFGGLALPALGAGLGARLMGATELSQGRSMIAAAAALSALGMGFGLMVTSDGDGFGVPEAVGSVLVGFAAPALATLSDYVFRTPRGGRTGVGRAEP